MEIGSSLDTKVVESTTSSIQICATTAQDLDTVAKNAEMKPDVTSVPVLIQQISAIVTLKSVQAVIIVIKSTILTIK